MSVRAFDLIWPFIQRGKASYRLEESYMKDSSTAASPMTEDGLVVKEKGINQESCFRNKESTIEREEEN